MKAPRANLLVKLVGAVGLLIVLGLGGLSLVHQHLAARHLEGSLVRGLLARVELMERLVANHHQTMAAYRAQEETAVRRHLEHLAAAYRQLCVEAQRQVAAGALTLEQAKAQVSRYLEGQKIGLSGYPFAWDISRAPERIPLAAHPKLHGQDVAYVDFVQRAAVQREGYLEYFWGNPEEKVPRLKGMALAYFEPWQWVIAASAYKSEFPLLRDPGFYEEADRALAAEIARVRVGERGYAMVVDNTGLVVVPPSVGRPFPDGLSLERLAAEPGGVLEINDPERRLLVVSRPFPDLGWVLVVVADADELLAPAMKEAGDTTVAWLLGLTAVAFLVLATLLGHLVVRPARRLGSVADRIASGDLSAVPRDLAASTDEMGDLARSLDVMAVRLSESMQSLAHSEQRYRTLFDSAPEPGWVVSKGGFIMRVNPAAAALLGRSQEELVGRHFGTYLAPDQWGLVLAKSQEAFRSGEAQGGIALEFVDSQGRTRLVEGFLCSLREAAGQVAGFYGMGRDLTEQRELAAQLLQAQKMEVVGTLAGGMAHDFNNLLASILGYSSLLLEQGDLGEQARRWLSVIDESASRAAGLTRQLLDFAKGGDATREPVEVNRLVEDVLAILERSFHPKVELVRDLDPAGPAVSGDTDQLHQALMNVCINARDAMPGGGRLTVRTRAETDAGRRALDGESLGGQVVVITVADTGQGMDEVTLNRALEPFYTTKKQGTGLGLAMVYGIVKRHGGALEIDSRPGQGASIRLVLPAAAGEDAPAGESVSVPANGGRETVLVVDDERSVREMAGEVLSAMGYRVLLADGGREALRMLNGEGAIADLVLLDVVMPGMDGLEVLEVLRRRAPGLPVILTSGMQDASRDRPEGLPRADAFLPKPYRARELLVKVREVLDERRM